MGVSWKLKSTLLPVTTHIVHWKSKVRLCNCGSISKTASALAVGAAKVSSIHECLLSNGGGGDGSWGSPASQRFPPHFQHITAQFKYGSESKPVDMGLCYYVQRWLLRVIEEIRWWHDTRETVHPGLGQ